MRSPLLTLLLVVLGWPVAVLLVIGGHSMVSGWIAAEYPSPPAPGPPPPQIRHPGYRVVTETALQAYRALPDPERESLWASLQTALIPADEWLQRLDRSDFTVLCLGEDHAEATRQYLHRQLLPRLRYDRLLLEVSAEEPRPTRCWPPRCR